MMFYHLLLILQAWPCLSLNKNEEDWGEVPRDRRMASKSALNHHLSQDIGPRCMLPPTHIAVQTWGVFLHSALQFRTSDKSNPNRPHGLFSILSWSTMSSLSKQRYKKGDSKYLKHSSRNTLIHHHLSVREVQPSHFTSNCGVLGHLSNWSPTWVYSWPWDLYWLWLLFPNPYASRETSGYFSS